jgi:hypothetical protein
MKDPIEIFEEEALPAKTPKKRINKAKNMPKEWSQDELKKCRERLGINGVPYPNSTPDEWSSYNNDTMWVHKSERSIFSAYYAQSSVTGKWFHTNKLVRTYEDRLISQEDVENGDWEKCASTGYYSPRHMMLDAFIVNRAGDRTKVRISSPGIDNRSFFMCSVSGKFYSCAQKTVLINAIGQRTAAALYEIEGDPRFKHCDNCNYWVGSEMVLNRLIDGDRRMMCEACYSRHRRKGLINAHNYDRYPAAIYTPVKFRRMTGEPGRRRCLEKEEPNLRLFGVELEVEMNSRGCRQDSVDRWALAQEVKEAVGEDFVVMKEDGSLNENGKYSDPGAIYAGFEIVSAPADFAVHKQKWQLLENMPHFKHLRAWDTETCGMHVHVSRDALSTLQIGRILTFMTHEDNKKFIAKVAGRGENKYCRILHKEKISSDLQYGESEVRDGIEYIKATYQIPRCDDNRRQAVNITNEKTIEFRVFRGTIHPRHIIRNMEFVDAMCNYCYPCTRSFKALLDWREFVNYCLDNRKAYPLLVEWYESDKIGLLPKRNAYGPKDTRGTNPPEVVEADLEPKSKKVKLGGGIEVDEDVIRAMAQNVENPIMQDFMDIGAIRAAQARDARRGMRAPVRIADAQAWDLAQAGIPPWVAVEQAEDNRNNE